MSGKQLRKTLLNFPGQFFIATDQAHQVYGRPVETYCQELFDALVDSGFITIEGECDNNLHMSGIRISTNENYQIFPGNRYFLFNPDQNVQSIRMQNGTIGANENGIRPWIAQGILGSFYAFQAERLNIGISDVNAITELAPNGQNLAQVLHKLREDNQKFQEYVKCVSAVLPNIAQVIPTIISSNQVEVKIAFYSEGIDRPDLLFGLNECGTGVSQVLCILYVAITSRSPTTIIIDEPNSFLHPGASKKLIEVLKTYSRHQYIISTHSPELIQVADPEQLLLTSWSVDGSKITSIDRRDVHAIRIALGELGVNLSDLFGYDQVIWVEGQTEASVFPLILEHRNCRLRNGTAFVPLRATGDILSNQKEAFFDIYNAVTSTNSVLPAALAFSLDSESLSELQKEDINRRSNGITKFLPRKTFENYLLHPKAIVALFESKGKTIEEGIVLEQFVLAQKKEPNQQIWLETVDGAKLISSLFKSASGNEFIYRKVEHGAWLGAWILKNDPDHLRDLCDYVLGLVGQYGELKQSH